MTPIATHDLTTGDGRSVTIEIYTPTPDLASPSSTPSSGVPEVWHCDFRLTGAIVASQHGSGVDSFGALVNAIQGVRKYIDDSGLVLTWNGAEPGEHWVPFLVPQYFGLAFEREILDEIDRRVAALGSKRILSALRALTQRLDEGAPYDELVETLNAIASSPSANDPQVAEALRQARSMLDARSGTPPAKL
jgi:hypothetical protein